MRPRGALAWGVMTAMMTPTRAPSSPIPDYLCDPRLSRVGLIQIRKYLHSTGKVPEDMSSINTKFALVSLAEKYQVPLEEFLTIAVGPAEIVPADQAVDHSIPEALPATPQHLVVETEIQSLPTNGMLSSIKARETKQRNDAKAAEVAAAQVLEAEAKAIRAVAGDKTKSVESARQKKAEAEKAAKARLEGATASLKKLKGIGATTDLLGLDVKVLEDAIAEAKAFKVPEEALAKYVELCKTATAEQMKAKLFAQCKSLSAAEALKLDTKGLRQAMADAKTAGVTDEQLAEFNAPLLTAETEQARKNILDVVDAISDPASAMSVDVGKLRAFLETPEVKAIGDAHDKLQAQLDITEQIQTHLIGMEALAFPPNESILKVQTVKLHFAVDEAKEAGIPDELIEKYEERFNAANEAQSHLKRADELKAAIKEAQGKGEDGQEELRALKAELETVQLQITAHEADIGPPAPPPPAPSTPATTDSSPADPPPADPAPPEAPPEGAAS